MPIWPVNFNTRVNVGDPRVGEHVAKVHALASVIRDIPIPPSVQRKIDALNILRAVRGTTGIEGAELTEDEVKRIMETPKNRPVLPINRRREELEARNAEELMYYLAKQVTLDPDLALSEGVICKIHEITTKDIDYPNNTPGKYREHAVGVGTYVPPPTGEEVRRLMKEFVDWFNKGTPSSWDPVIRAIVAHFYVVSIHPFGDGNGRAARGVESLLLYQARINARGFYSLANFYYRNRSEYVAFLDHVRFQTNGDLTPFVIFALQGLVSELEVVHNEVLSEVRLISFRDFARETLSMSGKLATKAGDRMFHFLLALENPVPLKDLRARRHPLSHFYRRVTNKTLTRDTNFLVLHQLVIIKDGNLQANLDVMTRFTPPGELLGRATIRKVPRGGRQ